MFTYLFLDSSGVLSLHIFRGFQKLKRTTSRWTEVRKQHRYTPGGIPEYINSFVCFHQKLELLEASYHRDGRQMPDTCGSLEEWSSVRCSPCLWQSSQCVQFLGPSGERVLLDSILQWEKGGGLREGMWEGVAFALIRSGTPFLNQIPCLSTEKATSF